MVQLSGKPADKIGLAKGDIIISISGETIGNTQELVDNIKLNANKEVNLKWIRNGAEMNSKVLVSADSTIGIDISSKYEGSVKELRYNVITAIPHAFNDMYYFGVEVFFKSIGKVIIGDIPFKKAIGGSDKNCSGICTIC